MATNHPHDSCAEALADVREKYFGTFDTSLPCHCGSAAIADHATEAEPASVARDRRQVVYGPSPAWHELLDQVKVYHAYWCEACGAVYMASVIEDVRGYKPLEVREPIPRSHDIFRRGLEHFFKGI